MGRLRDCEGDLVCRIMAKGERIWGIDDGGGPAIGRRVIPRTCLQEFTALARGGGCRVKIKVQGGSKHGFFTAARSIGGMNFMGGICRFSYEGSAPGC